MRRKIICWLLATSLLLTLTACGCKHEWNSATCDTPKTCVKCGETDGTAPGHSWLQAGCIGSQSCTKCGISQGEPLGHDWQAANCTVAEKCSRCKETRGSALGHRWEDSVTDASRNCVVCGYFEENRDPRFSAEEIKSLRGQWCHETTFQGTWFSMDKTYDGLACTLILELDSVGNGTLRAEFPDEKAFMKVYKRQFIKDTYAEFRYEGLTKEETDLVMDRLYGMTMDQYAATEIENMTQEEIYGEFSRNLAYYADNGDLYFSENWNAEFIMGQFSQKSNVLTLHHPLLGDEPLDWIKIPPA